MSRALVAIALALPSLALAQPMGGGMPGMPDPSRMSGIPRPDPQVPAGTLTVRLARGDFAHPLAGHAVTVESEGAAPKSATTDEAGRATFGGLTAGTTYVARATDGEQALASQPIEMPPSPGVRVALVFAAPVGTVDGKARADRSVPKGSVELRVVDEYDKPLAGLPVILAHGTKGSDKVVEEPARTDGAGRARWGGLAISDQDGYVATAIRDGLRTSSEPFVLDNDRGSVVALRAVLATRDARAVTLGKKSHFILQVRDDDLEVVENLVFENSATSPFDPGPAGIRISLPKGAVGAQAGPNAPPELTVEGDAAIYKGALPPGETGVPIAFLLPQHDHGATLEQRFPFRLERVAVITDHYDGMELGGSVGDREDRTMNGRAFWLATGDAIDAGKPLELRVSGLPQRPTWGRDLAVLLALLIAGWGIVATATARRGGGTRLALERQRLRLLDEVAKVPAGDPRRAELLARLERVYRDLDQAAS